MNEEPNFSDFGECCVKLWEEDTLTPKLVTYNDGTGVWTIGFGCTEVQFFCRETTLSVPPFVEKLFYVNARGCNSTLQRMIWQLF